MEHVEKTGVHSGDSISVYPTFDVSQQVKDKIIDYTVKLGKAVRIPCVLRKLAVPSVASILKPKS